MIILTGRKLEEIGRALFGADWQTPMAAKFRKSVRTVRRWANDDVAKPAELRVQLVVLIEDQLHALAQLHEELGGRE